MSFVIIYCFQIRMNASKSRALKTVRIFPDRIVVHVTKALRKPIHQYLQMESVTVSFVPSNSKFSYSYLNYSNVASSI